MVRNLISKIASTVRFYPKAALRVFSTVGGSIPEEGSDCVSEVLHKWGKSEGYQHAEKGKDATVADLFAAITIKFY